MAVYFFVRRRPGASSYLSKSLFHTWATLANARKFGSLDMALAAAERVNGYVQRVDDEATAGEE
jgi:hypothetical protein